MEGVTAIAAIPPAAVTSRQSPASTVRAASFSDAVREHQDEVYGVALRLLADPDLAHDATNATFLKAYRAFDRYDPSRPIRHWLLRIAINEARSVARTRARDRSRQVGAEAAADLTDRAAAPDAEAISREERVRIRRAVAALPELYRVPLVLRYFNELSVAEIAGVTGRPASTIGVQLLRGRSLLREALDGDDA